MEYRNQCHKCKTELDNKNSSCAYILILKFYNGILENLEF